ncbi:MAG TPA: T9SS type A sorting domain-containing protein [Flavobacterium alvei]|nr:T9SS type A sorting domain-containing protein [Flavobacterium alvei]
MKKIIYKIAVLLLLILSSGISYAQQIAFPGAEGYGKYTVGGRGGVVYEVTNLNDSGTGSLRAAVEASGPRTVVFRVSGTITLNSDLKISNPYLTIAGQTAPGDGICLRKYALVFNNAVHDVIVRYLRVRLGNESGGESDAVSARDCSNIILDHVSASWSVDETMSLYFCPNITIQWCMVSESLYNSNHPKGNHGYGGINGSNNSTSHHNLLAHHSSRNPRMASGCGYFDYRNNVIYNWGFNSTYGGEQQQVGDVNHAFSTINMVANYYKPGPATKPGNITYRIVNPSSRNLADDYGKWYVDANVMVGNTAVTANNWNGGVQPQDGNAYLAGLKLDNPWPAMAFNQQTASDAYYSVLDNVGATLPKRDVVDARIVNDTRNGNATYEGPTYETVQSVPDKTKMCGIIDLPDNVGGWPVLSSTTAPTDTDKDGMPDDWEIAKGLNPNNASDRNTVGTDGYTNLEKYLNSIEFNYPVTDYKLTKPTGTTYKLEWRDDYIAEDGFIVERSYNNGPFQVIATLPQYANNYTDTPSFTGLVTYRVVAFNVDNTSPRTTSISDGALGLNDKTLDNSKIICSPNPFSNELTIEIPVLETQKIRIELFDIGGKKVATIADRLFETGNNSLLWNSSNSNCDLKSGVYIISFSNTISTIKKEVKLIKK